MAQGIPVSGKVTDAKEGNPLPGVSVSVAGANTGGITDVNGQYKLTLPAGGKILVFKFTGMKSLEMPVNGRAVIDVQLESTEVGLNEVVVVGYGTQRKGDVTSAIASVKSENFVKGAVRDAAQLIQGKVAGLTVSTPSGNPTSNTQIQLRGITTLKAGTSPLILIDGIPGSLNTVAPEDIESVDVLKDGSAAAIYGTRGTNGVILITTKKLHGEMKPTIQYDGYVSLQAIARRPEFLTGDDYRRLIKEGIDFTDYGSSTDWLKEITRSPVSHTHNLSFQGGSPTTNVTASLNYRNWEGLFVNSNNKQITGRADVNHVMLDGKLKANLNVITRSRTYWSGVDAGEGGFINGNSFNNYVYRQAMIRNPTDSVRNYKGDWLERNIYFYDNPVAYLMESYGQNDERETRLNGSLTLEPVKDLRMKLLVSGNKWSETRGYAETKKHVSTVKNNRNGYASRGTSDMQDNLLEFTTEYTRSIRKHRFNLLGGYSYQDNTRENFYMQNWDFPTDQYSYNNMEAGDALKRGEAVMGSFKDKWKLIGFFGRLSYNWDDKYLLLASVRHEGSTKFGSNSRWGTFPAVSLGWRVSKETFMTGLTWLDDLKLRAGFGVTGTVPDDLYASLRSFNYGNRFLINGVWVQGLDAVRNPNAELQWEKKEEFNVGVDFSLFGSRISGSIDAYRRLTKDAIFDYQVPVPPYPTPEIVANAAQIRNQGLEVLLNFVPVSTRNFQWNSGFNYSTNKNVLVSLSSNTFATTNDYFDAGYTGEPIQEPTHRVQVGRPIGNFYGYKSIGIDDNGRWIIEGKDGKPVASADKSPDDKQILGNGLPKHFLGWNNSVRYKRFDLNVTMRGAFGFQILNFQRLFYENPKVVQYNMLKTAFDNVYGKTRLNDDLALVSYYVENGDYWKVDNVTLGYNFNTKRTRYIQAARIYVAALNLATITGYKGIDPEVIRTGLAPGDDERDKYPTTRTFTLGVNLTF
ncbi:SusC/RagA family TonB-linked outer membrane protein [Chitinophaga agrisoli]|uniref:SusC/RagA family TonB-linked outer membrane protein n=2 Tax=Chitinophaga agrisoli TaxID=2607653 RepID=A0A5B2W5G3_9BACT|nr:SusC/RagA family TonB-linked outer membrane protein [Chitinophaga agrisoli]